MDDCSHLARNMPISTTQELSDVISIMDYSGCQFLGYGRYFAKQLLNV
jgi:hypothetical protein